MTEVSSMLVIRSLENQLADAHKKIAVLEAQLMQVAENQVQRAVQPPQEVPQNPFEELGPVDSR